MTAMAHLAMVKTTTTCNGIHLPSICRADEASRSVTTFGHEDEMQRLS